MSENMKPQSRVEQILDAMLNGGEIPAPQSRIEAYLAALYNNRLAGEGPLDIEWDGVIGDKYSVPFMGGFFLFVKVSDCLPTYEEMQTATVISEGLTYKELITVELDSNCTVTCIPDDGVDGDIPIVVVVREPTVLLDSIVVNETGLYFAYAGDSVYVTGLHLDKFVRKIPEKYLPNTEIPVINLADFGFDMVIPDGSVVTKEASSSADPEKFMVALENARKALSKGIVKVVANFYMGSGAKQVSSCYTVLHNVDDDIYAVSSIIMADVNTPAIIGIFKFTDSSVAGQMQPLTQ